MRSHSKYGSIVFFRKYLYNFMNSNLYKTNAEIAKNFDAWLPEIRENMKSYDEFLANTFSSYSGNSVALLLEKIPLFCTEKIMLEGINFYMGELSEELNKDYFRMLLLCFFYCTGKKNIDDFKLWAARFFDGEEKEEINKKHRTFIKWIKDYDTSLKWSDIEHLPYPLKNIVWFSEAFSLTENELDFLMFLNILNLNSILIVFAGFGVSFYANEENIPLKAFLGIDDDTCFKIKSKFTNMSLIQFTPDENLGFYIDFKENWQQYLWFETKNKKDFIAFVKKKFKKPRPTH